LLAHPQCRGERDADGRAGRGRRCLNPSAIGSRRLMDALSETLRVVRLVGAIFINARFSAPWSYQSPSADSAASILEPGAERVVIFHLITEGECYVELGDAPP